MRFQKRELEKLLATVQLVGAIVDPSAVGLRADTRQFHRDE